jgi:hypothetical protein
MKQQGLSQIGNTNKNSIYGKYLSDNTSKQTKQIEQKIKKIENEMRMLRTSIGHK